MKQNPNNGQSKLKEISVEKNLESNTTAVTKLDFFNIEQFAAIQRVAKMFIYSDLVPEMYRVSNNNPESKAISNTVIALDMAQRLNANPLMVMQNLVVIHNRPSWSSKFLISTINTCGRFNPLKFRITNEGKIKNVNYTEYVWDSKARKNVAKVKTFTEEVDNLVCVAYTSPKNDKDNVLESSPISIEMAIKEGWYTKNGSKWRTMEKQMLMYRAASFWTSAYAPELSMGMLTVEESHDIIDAEFTEIPEEEKINQTIKENANKEDLDLEINPDQSPEEKPDDSTGLSDEEKAAIEAEEKEQAKKEQEEMFENKSKSTSTKRKPGFAK